MEPHVHHVDINRYIQSTEGTHSLLVWLIIGLVAGYLTGRIMRGAGPFGPLVDIIVGVIGAIIGGLIMVTLGYAGNRRLPLHRLRRRHRSGRPHPPLTPRHRRPRPQLLKEPRSHHQRQHLPNSAAHPAAPQKTCQTRATRGKSHS